MPFDRVTGLFSRAWRFIDRFAQGDDITRSDLDIMADDLAAGINAALTNSLNFTGEWLAAGAFPTARPDLSRIRARDTWRVTSNGTVQGVAFAVDDYLVALQADPGPTYAGNWLRVPNLFLPAVLAALEEIEALEASAADAATAAGGSATAAQNSASAAALALGQVLAVQGSLPEWRGAWQTGTAYGLGDLVGQGGSSYICVVAHTSGTFSTDLGASRWAMFAQQGAAGAGTGDMLGANNLSDVANTATARSNLGAQASNALLSAIAALGVNGIIVRTSASAATVRTILGGTGIQVANGDGILGNPTVSVSNLTMAMISGLAKRLSGSGGADVTDDQIPSALWVREAVYGYLRAAGDAPLFAARFGVNFNGVPRAGTYSRTGSTVTVTMANHGMATGQFCRFFVTSGGAVNNYNTTITVVDANTFTYTDGASGSTSGNLERNTWARAFVNLFRVIRNGTGEYTLMFTVPLAGPDYLVLAMGTEATSGQQVSGSVVSQTTTEVRVVFKNSSNTPVDCSTVSVVVF